MTVPCGKLEILSGQDMENHSEHILRNMQAEEYARIFRGRFERICNIDGVVWREVRPLFWRPYFPFFKYKSNEIRIPLHFRLGGFQFCLHDEIQSNSFINYYIFNDVKKYRLETLKGDQRRDVVKCMKYIHVEAMKDPDEFLKISYPVYVSFMQRTQYGVRNDLMILDTYNKWWKSVVQSENILILCAYYNDKLVGVSVLSRVDDVVIIGMTFTHSDYLSFSPAEALFHTARTLASNLESVKYIYAGLRTDNQGVNSFKENRGAVLVQSPSYYHVNPLAQLLLKAFGGKYLKKISGELHSHSM